MIKWLLRRQIRKLEKSHGYDATYLHEMLDASLGAFVRFSLFQFMASHRHDVPVDVWFAAKIAAVLSEDCGPCTQLVVDMALQGGVPANTISALVRGDIEQAGPAMELGYRYGMAVATNAPEMAKLTHAIERKYGKGGLVSLSMAVASTRVYPSLKRGLGHGAACMRVVVSDKTITLKQAA